MAVLQDLLGGLMGGGTAASPVQGALMGLLGGGDQMGAQGTAPGTGAASMGGGGLGGLVSSFEAAGLGHIAQSWVGNGPNQQASPQQLQSVFGESKVQNAASQAGMAPNDFLSQLSQHLPNAVNQMTPSGRLPDEGSVSV